MSKETERDNFIQCGYGLEEIDRILTCVREFAQLYFYHAEVVI